jgi:hypothetical protein
MNAPSSTNALAKVFFAFTVPALVVVLAVWLSTSVPVEDALVRFANAMLTSFTLVSFMLMVTLISYGDARKRPFAPLFGMLLVVGVGVALTLFFLSQGDLLMEDNGSVRAQALSNIIRFGTTSIAMLASTLLVGGVLFASLLNTPTPPVFSEEE